ncbi:hypothetical protein DRW42_25545 [Pedobacter miscanthi]|uniref:Uncharacterized protein n=1 Tax=Pedobacter miscanthi TaxID=2259170 RepID=A0A366KPJ7_9SPHI|nr:hypothetical protein DRW42_25545 [Pedobacter miscanthi]
MINFKNHKVLGFKDHQDYFNNLHSIGIDNEPKLLDVREVSQYFLKHDTVDWKGISISLGNNLDLPIKRLFRIKRFAGIIYLKLATYRNDGFCFFKEVIHYLQQKILLTIFNLVNYSQIVAKKW